MFLLGFALIAAVQGDVPEIIKAKKLRCGTSDDRTLFGKKDGGKYTGFDVEMCEQLAKVLGVTVEYVKATSVNRFGLLVDNKVDVLTASTTDTIGRRTRYNVTFSTAYFFDGQGFLVPKDSSTEPSKFAKICVEGASTSFENVQSTYPDATLLTAKSTTAAFETMKKGECEAVTSDKGILADFVTADYKILPDVISLEPIAMSFRNSDVNLNQVATQTIMTLLYKDAVGHANYTVPATLTDWADTDVMVGVDLSKVSTTYSAAYTKYLEDKIPIAGTKNELATEDNSGLFVVPESVKSEGTPTTLKKRSLKDIIKSGKVNCAAQYGAEEPCKAVAGALFNDITKYTVVTKDADVDVNANYAFKTTVKRQYGAPIHYKKNSSNIVAMATAVDADPVFTDILHAVRTAFTLMDQFDVPREGAFTTAKRDKLPNEARRMFGYQADKTNNFGFGTTLKAGFMETWAKAKGSHTTTFDADKDNGANVFNAPYTSPPGKMWATVWNGENIPAIKKSAGYWKSLLDGDEAVCIEYFLPESSTTNNRLYYNYDDELICIDTFDLVNMRGISECEEVTDEEAKETDIFTYTWAFKINEDGTETYATLEDHQQPPFTYPSSFQETAGVLVESYEKCPPPDPPTSTTTKSKNTATTMTLSLFWLSTMMIVFH